jgi:hypothetical protein
MTTEDPADIVRKLMAFREEHRDLDRTISHLVKDSTVDQLRVRRMKKRKLKLKDWISYLESRLIPDLDA